MYRPSPNTKSRLPHFWPSPARRAGLVGILLVLLGLLPAAADGYRLSSYVRKYARVTATNDQMAAIGGYDHLIDHFSHLPFFHANYRVSADFMRALILSESNGDPGAVSNKNALGLCQILFPTGQLAARELLARGLSFRYVSAERLRNLTPADLHDPAVNILLACYLIAKYNHKFDGRLDLVVSAWNAGENSIFLGQPPPYEETLDLIGKVNGYFVFFRNRS